MLLKFHQILIPNGSFIHSFIYCIYRVYRCVFQPSLFIVIPFTEIKFIKKIFLVAVKAGSKKASELSFYQVLYNQVIDESFVPQK